MVNNDEPAEHPGPPRRAAGLAFRPWLMSLVLGSPALIPILCHYAAPTPGRLPTGFLQFDMPYYLANAREHFDNGAFRLLYSNPFDARYESPAIYVQPMSLAMGTVQHATGLDPGLLFLGFKILVVWACGWVAIALYREVVGLDTWPRRLGLLAFFWGGGVLALSGIGYIAVRGGNAEDIFRFDPGRGWWFLNFGRNFVYPTEALYHALFFATVLCILRRRWLASGVLAFLVSVSHPFTGVELLLILATWSALEVLFVQSTAVPRAYFAAVLGLLALHIGYYLLFLSSFPEHRKIMDAWKIPWTMEARNFVPAYALVGGLAFWSFRRLDLARQFFGEPRNRLFLTWFLVAFALANHEFAMQPIQPMHFTRGYIWTPLFLMGTPALVGLLSGILRPGRPLLGAAGVMLVMGVMLLDNVLWMAKFPTKAARGQSTGLFVTAPQRDLYRWLARDENRGSLLLTGDSDLAYLAAVYTPIRSWIGGHHYNTPDYGHRLQEMIDLREQGRMVPAWSEKVLLLVVDRDDPPPHPLSEDWGRPVYENADYLVYRRAPGQPGLADGPGTSATPP